jgi:beta-galactosidase
MYIGVDYYPEHWSKERWELDALLMHSAGFNVVRMAEFSWVFMEPEEGKFQFDWLDEVLDLLAKHEIQAILGTPTAVMPAWMAKKYPDSLAVDKYGNRLVWGVRKNNCFSSMSYNLLSERIIKTMAEHFSKISNVIGWQIDNEFGGPICYCEICHKNFQEWLKNKYQSIENLNKSLGTHFWGHKFNYWNEIPIPDDMNTHNPGLCLDWKRFCSWMNVKFQHNQVKILRELCPKHFITHNFMGLYPDINYYDLSEDLDHVSWDNYPVWKDNPFNEKQEIFYGASLSADVMRGLKQKNFWIMEQTAGPGGWGSFGRNTLPGEIKKISYQQLAHGADGIIWFRWRTCTAGREQYWHGLLGHDGKPLRRYKEAAETSREFHMIENEIKDTAIKTQAAIIYDYDSIWATQIQPSFDGNNYVENIHRYYNALLRQGINVDIIKQDEDFSKYKIIIASSLYILKKSTADKITTYVKNGGIFLTDFRSGVKNETNICYDITLPGLLTDVLGIEIEEYSAIPLNTEYPIKNVDGNEYHAIKYMDWITVKNAEVLANYQVQYLNNFAALTKNNFGKGRAYYAGTIIKEENFYDELIENILKDSGISSVIKPPLGVEISIRQDSSKILIFLINHTINKKEVKVPSGAEILINLERIKDTIILEPFGVEVIKIKKVL